MNERQTDMQTIGSLLGNPEVNLSAWRRPVRSASLRCCHTMRAYYEGECSISEELRCSIVRATEHKIVCYELYFVMY